MISLVTGYIIWALLRKNRKITGWNKIVFDEHPGYNEGKTGCKYCEIYIFSQTNLC